MIIQSTLESVFSWNDILWFNYSVTLGIVFKHAQEQGCQIQDQENDSGVHYKRYDYQVHSGGGTVLPELLTNKQW